MKSMPKSLARGFQTSQPTGNFLELASVEINRTVAEFDAIQRDQTMTRAQRSPALFKLRETAKSALGKQLTKARNELDVENIAALTAERDAIKHQMDVADHRADCAERIVAKLECDGKVLTLTGSEARFLRTYLQWHAETWGDIVRIPNWPGDKRTVRRALRQGDAILARLEA